MKNKQILALILSAALAVSPAAVMAEEAVETEAAAEIAETVEPAAEPAVEETVQEEAVTPETEETVAEPEASAEVTEAAEETVQEETIPEATEAPSNQIASEAELMQAIAAAADNVETELVLAGDFSITQGISVPAGKNILLTAEQSVTITRAAGFTGDLFVVGGTLQMQKTLTSAGTITVDGSGEGTTGSIAKVQANAVFGIDDIVTLRNNDTTALGGAVNNEGNLIIDGAVITGNTATDGAAVYSTNAVIISNAPTVTGNLKKDTSEENGIALEGNGIVVVDSMLSNTAPIQVYRVNGVEGETVLTDRNVQGAAASAAANGQIVYAGEELTINESGVLAAAETETPAEEAAPEEVPTVTPVLTKADDGTTGIVWAEDGSEFTFTVVSDTDGEIYWGFGDTGSEEDVPEFDLTESQGTVIEDEVFTITVERDEIPTEADQTLYVLIKSDADVLSAKKSIPVEIPEITEPEAEDVGEEAEEAEPETPTDNENSEEPETPTDGEDSEEPEKLKITVTTTGEEVTYDGKEHSATVQVTGLPDGYTAEASSSAKATHVSESPVTATCDTLVIKNSAGEDVTALAEITQVNGTIIINPAELTVTTESDEKVYDGNELTAGGNFSGLVSDELCGFNVTGSQTEVGSSTNTYKIEWAADSDEYTAVETDYTITENLGTLTVTEKGADPDVTRDPIVADINNYVITGLEEALELKAGVYYPFQVRGAGTLNSKQEITSPYVDGDTRWVPAYWSSSIGGKQQNSWKIGSAKDINKETTMTIYVYFQKQIRDSSTSQGWVSGGYSYVPVTITTKTFDSSSSDDTDGDNTDGTGGAGDDATVNDGVSTGTGSTSAANAKTADTNPIGTLSMMAMLSLLAGGYVIVRKRKKEEI